MKDELQQLLDDILQKQEKSIEFIFGYGAMDKELKARPFIEHIGTDFKHFKDSNLEIKDELQNNLKKIIEEFRCLIELSDFPEILNQIKYKSSKEKVLKILTTINDSTSFERTNPNNEMTNLIKAFINDRLIRNELRLLNRDLNVAASPIEEGLDSEIDNSMINTYQNIAERRSNISSREIQKEVISLIQRMDDQGLFNSKPENNNDTTNKPDNNEPNLKK